MSKELRKVQKQLDLAQQQLRAAVTAFEKYQKSQHKSYEDVPGIEGVFDGTHMVTKDGEKYEVSPNYAAKSHLPYGTKLKMVKEDGKNFFKQVEKIETKEIEGVLSKKAGKWHILADCGSYLVSDVAADFHQVVPNMEATALIPKGNTSVPFAALKKVKREKEEVASEKKEATKPAKKVEKKAEKKVEKKPEEKRRPLIKKKEAPKKDKKEEKPVSKELDEDDLR